jgi:hypothetical protein
MDKRRVNMHNCRSTSKSDPAKSVLAFQYLAPILHRQEITNCSHELQGVVSQ